MIFAVGSKDPTHNMATWGQRLSVRRYPTTSSRFGEIVTNKIKEARLITILSVFHKYIVSIAT